MYRTSAKRIMSGLMGFFQMFSALCTYYCVASLIIRTQTVIDCVKDFGALIIITEIDNWVGEYFLKTRRNIRKYTDDDFKQLSVVKRKESTNYNWLSIVEDIVLVFVLIIVLIPIYHSISIFY
jgi:hypothetical protein